VQPEFGHAAYCGISAFGHAANARHGKRIENVAMTRSNGIELRAATLDDAEAICAIYNAALAERAFTFETEPRTSEDFEGRIVDGGFPVLVAEREARVVGWAGVGSYNSRPCYAGIGECSVYVVVTARGNGIGTRLVRSLADVSAVKGFHKLIGKLFTDNAASIRLIERCGFSEVGIHRRHGMLDDTWRDVLVVEQLLDVN
jgi:L-amino acid N-acyltransferase YncA